MPPAPAREHRRQRTLKGTVAPGTAFDAVTPLVIKIVTAGAKTLRIRAKVATQNATLSFFFLRPDGTRYASDNPSNLALTAGTEDMIDITCGGEEMLELSLIGAGAGTITWIDVMQAPV